MMNEAEIDEIKKQGFTEGPEEIWSVEDFYVFAPCEIEPILEQAKSAISLKAENKELKERRDKVLGMKPGNPPKKGQPYFDPEMVSLKDIQRILRGITSYSSEDGTGGGNTKTILRGEDT